MVWNKKLGYYEVDGKEFESKILACLYANKNNKKVAWKFNDSIFSSYKWHIEPEQSLDDLYDQRARSLREQYDYIIISYSGGADSHNIIESFLRQNLFIDEIVVNTMETADYNFKNISEKNKSSHSAPASEHVLQTIPRLKEIKNKSPKTKINVLDLSNFLFQYFESYNDASWILTKKEGLNPLNVTRFNYIHFSEIRKQFDKDKKIALLLGVEKPRTFISRDNNFCIRFNDRAANVASAGDFIKEYPNSTIEYFYWSPEAVDIICKQSHVIKKWLDINPQYKTLWYYKNLTNEIFRLVHERLLREILYSTWNPKWYQADKATKDWYSEFDSWFIDGCKNTKSHNVWLEGIRYLETNASHFVNNKKGINDGLVMFNHDYKICPIDFINIV